MSENKQSPNIETIMVEIQKKIYTYHDPGLVHPDESPNQNRINHLYSDGSVTDQKGSWAYLKRSEFVSYGPIYGLDKLLFTFPVKDHAIMTMVHCLEIRKLLKHLLTQWK